MNYSKFIKPQQSFSDLVRVLSAQPSPKAVFFQRLLEALDVSPVTLRMLLCTTPTGLEMSPSRQIAIEELLNIPARVLFPAKRMAKGSLIDMYMRLSRQPEPYEDFIKEVCQNVGVRRCTVMRWAAGSHRPSITRQNMLAKILNANIEDLFPEQATC